MRSKTYKLQNFLCPSTKGMHIVTSQKHAQHRYDYLDLAESIPFRADRYQHLMQKGKKHKTAQHFKKSNWLPFILTGCVPSLYTRHGLITKLGYSNNCENELLLCTTGLVRGWRDKTVRVYKGAMSYIFHPLPPPPLKRKRKKEVRKNES